MILDIKICGMSVPENIQSALRLQPDYLGLIFHRPSPRNAFGLDAETAAKLGKQVKLVGVFVNCPQEEILSLAEAYNLAVIQLHGDESPEFCQQIRERGYEVWKAAGIRSKDDFAGLESYVGKVDRFVFDSKSEARGGSGNKFDWRLLDAYNLPTDFILGGGLGPEDADSIRDIRHPRLAGIDLNSRFELSPGVKDTELLYNFIKNLRQL